MQKKEGMAKQATAEMVMALEAISRFRERVTGEHFLRIFGPRVGKHLWARFEGMNTDILVFQRLLDLENLRKFALAITEGVPLENDEVPF